LEFSLQFIDKFLYFVKSLENKRDTYVQKYVKQRKISPVTSLEWLRVFQEFKVPRFHDNGTGRW